MILLVLKDLYNEPFEKEPKCACFIFEEVFTTIIVSYENNIKIIILNMLDVLLILFLIKIMIKKNFYIKK